MPRSTSTTSSCSAPDATRRLLSFRTGAGTHGDAWPAALPARPRPGPPLGAHQSIAGGLHRALERGGSIGCQAVQLFTRSARQWALRPLAEDEVRAFAAARAATGIRALLAHDSYLPNPAAPGWAGR